ncbi:MAG: NADH-quinone oxidoreductase subunit L [Verrucomicrobia bacterium]|nr:NADH-quinone oxidoreductase subunit L [Verrucomicrobiota bacterium]MDA1066210.1 NADH-quinone oxidoreductase subunit L [Verrucomicrobiota bacterium]
MNLFDFSHSVGWLLWIPLCPLIAGVLLGFFKPSGKLSAIIAIAALTASLGFSLKAFAMTGGHEAHTLTHNFTWIQIAGVNLEFGVVLNALTGSMLAMVSFIGLLIFIYSASYMSHDARMGRFFCYLSIFMVGMLGLVVSNSLLLLFMFWEIVGLASYLLIGFWFEKPSAAAAAKKAFITTRIGDLGFLIGLLWAFKATGTFLFFDGGNGLLEGAQIAALVASENALGGLNGAGVIALFLFIGAVGKSGQLPLHVWLPDAMEGPTPVSALIHAATMVAAGVFLVARAFPLFLADEVMLEIVSWVGAFTALFAALIAVAQYDIKRILAYSTVSQLGLMMVGLGAGGLALGEGGVSIGMFHLLTHAFFKALLFLGAGSIIHGCGEEQDIRLMGGVFSKMKVSSIAYLAGTLALCAFPFTSGFFSKDQILLSAWTTNSTVFWISAFASLLTAFYMTRQCCYVFLGKYRGKGHVHESPALMTVPLVILAAFALLLGVISENKFHVLDYLSGVHVHQHETIVVVISVIIALGGIGLGLLVYARAKMGMDIVDPVKRAIGAPYSWLEKRLLADELYEATVFKLWNALAINITAIEAILNVLVDALTAVVVSIGNFFSNTVDQKLIDSVSFDGTCARIYKSSRINAFIQNGFLQGYLRILTAGTVVIGVLFLVFAR